MGFFDNLFRGRINLARSPTHQENVSQASEKQSDNTVATFSDKNITFTGDLASYDYDAILRDKQGNIIKLYELSDYFVDADAIYRGIIKHVYTPFCLQDKYRLIGANERVKQKYYEYYERIHLEDMMRSIFLQYFKYGNVYIYLMEDGSIITLPVHLVRIANILNNGEPIVEFNCGSIKSSLRQQGTKAQKNYIEDDDLQVRLSGYPPEVSDAIAKNKDWVQMNPENTFVLQDLKEDWMRYSVPMVAACLKAFAKKALISQYESAVLSLGTCSFVHVTYGDVDRNVWADRQMLTQIQTVFAQAMSVSNGAPLATTNSLCKAEVIQPNLNDLFEDDHYSMVNSEILSAGGVSGMIVSGISSTGSSYASAQISMQTAAIRIKQAKDNFCELMNKINLRLNGVLPRSSVSNIPKFMFPPVELTGSEKFQKTCRELWEKNVISKRTMLEIHGYDIGQEVERQKSESSGSSTEQNNQDKSNDTDIDNTGGRPTLDDSERNSDPGKSESGRQPKPSNPDGSQEQT